MGRVLGPLGFSRMLNPSSSGFSLPSIASLAGKEKMSPPTCQICDNLVSKYKCPSCLVPYCSLVCFKKHKESPCAKQPSSAQQNPGAKQVSHVVEKTQLKANAKEIPVARPINVEEEKYVLDKTELQAIASSSEIREALKDEVIQKLVCNIDTSSNPLQELDAAMGVEAFRVFTDKILSSISKSK